MKASFNPRASPHRKQIARILLGHARARVRSRVRHRRCGCG